MASPASNLLFPLRALRRPHLLAFLPLTFLGAYLAAGPAGVAVAAVVVPILLAVAAPSDLALSSGAIDKVTGLAQREAIIDKLRNGLDRGAKTGRVTGALVLEIDRFKLLEERHDRAAIERILRETADRVTSVLRDTDLAARLEGPTFAIALCPVRRLDLEVAIQLSARVQQAVAQPIAIDGANVYVTASIGFSLASRLSNPTPENLLQSATSALIEAQRYAPGAIRSFSEAMQSRISSRNELTDHVAAAMERGEIRAFFQPQVSSRTGAITGFETLARWQHPGRGLIPPVEFLPALQQAGLMDKLGEIMVYDALTALRRWDEAGFNIPRVGVNFSNEELRDPRLVDRIAWELDRFNLQAERLAIEVLETVVANHAEDIVLRNLKSLSRLGCSLDLDDFGTGHASITSIRNFSIERIKIDRSFITNIDADPEQQKMVSAILTMAERLGLDTLAEGVETPEEQAMLAKLGCGHLQGFGIARPLPPEDVDAWISGHSARLSGAIPFRRKAI
ncbi:putative bifunctional diguanylate cyclase/phosphodiesterase [Marivivens marinus]|uniref:putative bifunctional diguanylate cyclase/phosphodiesterase n=1 Tax=Marivivens marinus TaxID=3110173 RepID=UPI003B849528